MLWDSVLDATRMGGLAMLSVGLWTVRVSLVARDRKAAAAVAAGVEAVVFAVVFSEVLDTLQAPARLVGYAVGVGVGALAGMHLSDRLARGTSALRLVVRCGGDDVGQQLRQRGWHTTAMPAQAASGPATVLSIAVDDRRLPQLVADVERLAPDAFWTVERLRAVRPAGPTGRRRQPRRADGGPGPGHGRPQSGPGPVQGRPQGGPSPATIRAAPALSSPAARQRGPAVKRSAAISGRRARTRSRSTK